MKEEFLMLLRSVDREGMDELINFIEKSDFLKHQQVQDFMVVMREDF